MQIIVTLANMFESETEHEKNQPVSIVEKYLGLKMTFCLQWLHQWLVNRIPLPKSVDLGACFMTIHSEDDDLTDVTLAI